jgi:Flp pilus assembly protein CpaB
VSSPRPLGLPWRVRRRLRFWPVSLGLSLLAGVLTMAAITGAESAARREGQGVEVPVARRELTVGETIETDDIEWHPVATAAAGAAARTDPAGRVVTERVLAGEPIAADRLAPDGRTGAAALIPDGHRALAVPTGAVRPPVAPGDRVDVVGGAPFGADRATVVAAGARVVGVDDEVVTVAVAAAEVPGTARAVLDGTALLTLVASLDP